MRPELEPMSMTANGPSSSEARLRGWMLTPRWSHTCGTARAIRRGSVGTARPEEMEALDLDEVYLTRGTSMTWWSGRERSQSRIASASFTTSAVPPLT
jgi:hypothetical protein